MDIFNLLDQVKLTTAILLSSNTGNALETPEAAPIGPPGAIATTA
jgi:hypothetical protein